MSTNIDSSFTIGSRKSKLALIQTNYVISRLKEIYPDFKFNINEQDTIGDKNLHVALSKIGDKGLFTHELEECLKDGSIDFAVHSLKDLPTNLPDKMIIACILKRVNPSDVAIIRSDLMKSGLETLQDLNNSQNPDHHIIGTSSLRRQSQLKKKYQNLNFVDIRGNLDSRLRKLENENNEYSRTYSGIILAFAGLERQGESYLNKISQIIVEDDLYYAVGQGALAVECHQNNIKVLEMLSKINDDLTFKICSAERSLLRTLEGGCHAPIGVASNLLDDGKFKLKARVLSLDGSEMVQNEIVGDLNDAELVGKKLANELWEQGANKILTDLNKKAQNL